MAIAAQLPKGRIQFIDANGNPLASGTVTYYIPGTTTLKTTWQDAAQSVQNSNPVVLDALGQAVVYGNGSYREYVNDSLGNLVSDSVTTVYPISTALAPLVGASSLGAVVTLLGTAPFITPQQYGAVGNGSTDDSNAFRSANVAATAIGGYVYVPAASYAIASNVTFSAACALTSGAILNIANAVTVAFNRGFSADACKAFQLTGTAAVTFNSQYFTNGRPEWWGAVTNNASVDCAPALNAAIIACPNTILNCATYYTSSTVLHQTQGRSVSGATENLPQGSSSAPTIMLTNGTSNIYQIGPNSYTGTLQSNNTLKNITLARNVAPVISSNCVGLAIKFSVWTKIEEVFTYDSISGINLAGTAQTHLTKCVMTRYVSGTGGGTDAWTGIGVNGDYNIGYAGGNASIYINKCVVGSTNPGIGTGIVLYGTYGFSDVFVTQLETSNTAYGAVMIGNGNQSTTIDVQNEDVRFVDCTFDTCLAAGYSLSNLSAYASIEINGGYIAAPSTGTNPTGFYGTNCAGSVRISNTEVLLVENPQAIGMSLLNCSNWDSVNVAYLEGGYGGGVMTLGTITNCTFKDRFINNHAIAPGVAVTMTGTCDHVQLDIAMTGRSGAHTYGYAVPNTVSNSLFECSRINPNTINASPGKILFNGSTVISSAGTVFGSGNLPTGVMT